jgi:hypothetical protein
MIEKQKCYKNNNNNLLSVSVSAILGMASHRILTPLAPTLPSDTICIINVLPDDVTVIDFALFPQNVPTNA